MRFTKMHGLGNDYVYVDATREHIVDPAAVSRAISDRHFGIGSDGLILIDHSDKADVRMRMFNADGSESEMCGNGVRCVAKFAYDAGLSKQNPLRVETGRGVLSLAMQLADGRVKSVTVDMDEPIFEPQEIPILPKHESMTLQSDGSYRITLPSGTSVVARFVSMGNPHLVSFVDDVASVPLAEIGPQLETHAAFPSRLNVHFVHIRTAKHAVMRTWERGSGITLACGTGACAVLVAGVQAGLLERTATITLPGGDLEIEWRASNNHIYMTGPAVEVFRGEWDGLT